MHRAQFTARMGDDKTINPCKGLDKVLYGLLARSLAENDAVVKVASTDRKDDYVRISFPHSLILYSAVSLHLYLIRRNCGIIDRAFHGVC